MKVMILAAGEGKRMRPLTHSVPKPMLPIQGKPLIEHHLDRLVAAQFQRFVINVSYLGEQIVRHVEALIQAPLTVDFSQEQALLETGGGIYKALPLLGRDPFVLINGDVWTDYPLEELALPEGMLAHLVLVPNPPQHPEGDFAFTDVSDGNKEDAVPLRGGERKSAPRGLLKSEGAVQYTYAGFAVVDPELFEGCHGGRFPLPPLLRRAMQQGKVSGELYQGQWYDIGTPQRLEEINLFLSKGKA